MQDVPNGRVKRAQLPNATKWQFLCRHRLRAGTHGLRNVKYFGGDNDLVTSLNLNRVNFLDKKLVGTMFPRPNIFRRSLQCASSVRSLSWSVFTICITAYLISEHIVMLVKYFERNSTGLLIFNIK